MISQKVKILSSFKRSSRGGDLRTQAHNNAACIPRAQHRRIKHKAAAFRCMFHEVPIHHLDLSGVKEEIIVKYLYVI